jgi:hypothetical protein
MPVSKNYTNTESGYVAFLSTIIIGAILLVMTIEAGQSGFYTRFMVLGNEAKEQSRVLAIGCSAQAIGIVMANIGWAGNATTTESAASSCYILPLQKNYPLHDQMTIRIQSVVRGSVTNLVLVYDMKEILQTDTPLPPPGSPQVAPPLVIPQLLSWREVSVMP